MHHDLDDSDSDRELLARFAELPRTAPLTPGEIDRLANQLRDEGFFRARAGNGVNRVVRYGLAAAAAIVLFLGGAIAGMRYANRNSLETQLARPDLTAQQRVLLLQRAGAAYVQAAQSIADENGRVNSQAAEVADRILAGAANAVARTTLNAHLSQQLTSLLVPAPSANRRAVTWF